MVLFTNDFRDLLQALEICVVYVYSLITSNQQFKIFDVYYFEAPDRDGIWEVL